MSTRGSTVYGFEFGRLDVGRRELTVAGRVIDLQPRTFDLLAYFIANKGRAVSKDELLEKVWGMAVGTDAVVAQAVMKIRRALADDGQDPRYLKTVASGRLSPGLERRARRGSRGASAGSGARQRLRKRGPGHAAAAVPQRHRRRGAGLGGVRSAEPGAEPGRGAGEGAAAAGELAADQCIVGRGEGGSAGACVRGARRAGNGRVPVERPRRGASSDPVPGSQPGAGPRVQAEWPDRVVSGTRACRHSGRQACTGEGTRSCASPRGRPRGRQRRRRRRQRRTAPIGTSGKSNSRAQRIWSAMDTVGARWR